MEHFWLLQGKALSDIGVDGYRTISYPGHIFTHFPFLQLFSFNCESIWHILDQLPKISPGRIVENILG